MQWSDGDSLVRNLKLRAHQSQRDFQKKARNMRVINIRLFDSVLEYENFSFYTDLHCVNPRNPFQLNEVAINYELDSEDELQELMGDDANSDDNDEYDSEFSRGLELDGKGNDLECVNEGWLVPDDYFSDSDDSEVTPKQDENEAEYELRCQRRRIERERKRSRHVFQKRLEDRLQSLFQLGKQMRPVITTDEQALEELAQNKNRLEYLQEMLSGIKHV